MNLETKVGAISLRKSSPAILASQRDCPRGPRRNVVIDRQSADVQACSFLPLASATTLSTKISSPTDPSTAATTVDFESSLAELEAIVDKLEQGELSLDDSLQQFERGIQLTRSCQSALRQAEQKVEILLRKSGPIDAGTDPYQAAPFSGDDTQD